MSQRLPMPLEGSGVIEDEVQLFRAGFTVPWTGPGRGL